MSTHHRYGRINDGEEVEPLIFDDKEVRIVMVGKTGSGKSATGNTILGSEAFESKFKATSVTQDCKVESQERGDKKVSVVDTPGLFEANSTENQNHENLKSCIELAAPGPHVFLVAMELGRFTEEDQNTVNMIQGAFGQESNTYTMILFTHGDKLRDTTVEEFLKDSPELKELVDKCGGGCHVFNNEETTDRTQVTELLEKINKMVSANGGSHYTNEMFQKAQKQKARQDRLDRLGSIILPASVSVGTGIGAAVGYGIDVGATVGTVFAGPIGVAVGTAVGTIGGLAVVAGLHIHNKIKQNKAKEK